MKSLKKKRFSSCKNKSRKISDVVTSSLNSELSKVLKKVMPKYDKLEELEKQHPKKFNKRLVVGLGKLNANKYVFYFASKDRKKLGANCLKVLRKKIAYHGFDNIGITKTNSKGEAIFRFMCPQPYKENHKLYVSHVHFLVQESETRWEEKLYTVGVICSIDAKSLANTINRNCSLVLNSSELNDYVSQHIPNSFPLPASMTKNGVEIKKYIKALINGNKSLKTKFERSKVDIFEFPLVIYCNDKGCQSTDTLLNKLWREGFKNLKVYSGSVSEYKRINKLV
tara:strand:- start:7055 stop:7900 length:846 start_codon:yes stop_codon:yes gene_type:complete